MLYNTSSSQLSSRMEYVRSVHNTPNEQHVIFGVVFIVKIGQFAELWAARSHVHVRDGSLDVWTMWLQWFWSTRIKETL